MLGVTGLLQILGSIHRLSTQNIRVRPWAWEVGAKARKYRLVVTSSRRLPGSWPLVPARNLSGPGVVHQL